MTKQDYTHITVVFDRSGSMGQVQHEAEKAVNMFLIEQQKLPGEATLLFRDFDTAHETQFDGRLQDFRHYTLEPRGMTALWDAVAFSIKATGDKLSALPEDERPDRVIFVIQTDGGENSSSEYRGQVDNVRSMIKTQEDTFNWQFVFLGMGKDAWGGAADLGVSNFVAATANTGAANDATYQHINSTMRSYRGGMASSMAGATASVTPDGKVLDADGNEIDPSTGLRFKS